MFSTVGFIVWIVLWPSNRYFAAIERHPEVFFRDDGQILIRYAHHEVRWHVARYAFVVLKLETIVFKLNLQISSKVDIEIVDSRSNFENKYLDGFPAIVIGEKYFKQRHSDNEQIVRVQSGLASSTKF